MGSMDLLFSKNIQGKETLLRVRFVMEVAQLVLDLMPINALLVPKDPT